jgi:hypothetical protein
MAGFRRGVFVRGKYQIAGGFKAAPQFLLASDLVSLKKRSPLWGFGTELAPSFATHSLAGQKPSPAGFAPAGKVPSTVPSGAPGRNGP